MKFQLKFILLFLFVFLISGCSGLGLPAAATPAPDTLQPQVATPQSGTATVIGRFVHATTGKPFANEYAALAEVHRNEIGDAAFGLNTRTSPQTTTDANGYFKFENIPAREYVVISGDPMVRSMVLNDLSSGNAKVWNPAAGKVLDLGELKFEYINP